MNQLHVPPGWNSAGAYSSHDTHPPSRSLSDTALARVAHLLRADADNDKGGRWSKAGGRDGKQQWKEATIPVLVGAAPLVDAPISYMHKEEARNLMSVACVGVGGVGSVVGPGKSVRCFAFKKKGYILSIYIYMPRFLLRGLCEESDFGQVEVCFVSTRLSAHGRSPFSYALSHCYRDDKNVGGVGRRLDVRLH